MAKDLFDEFGIGPAAAPDTNVDLFDEFGIEPKPEATWGGTLTAIGKMLPEVGKSTVGGLLQFANDIRGEGLDNAQASTDRAAVLEAGRNDDPSAYQNAKSLDELQNLFTKDVDQVKNKGRYQYAQQQIDKNRKSAETQSGIGRMMFEKSMKRQQDIRPDFGPDDWGKQLIFDTGVAAEKMVPPLVVGAATRSPALAISAMAPTVLGDSYGNYRQRGYAPGESRQHAIVQTLIETGTEVPVFGRLFKTVGKSGLRKMLEVSLGEGLSESVSSLLSTAYEAGVVRDDTTLAEAFTSAQTYKNAAYEGAVGALLGFGMGGAMVPFDVAKQKRVIEDLKNSTADMQFTVWNDNTLNNAIDAGTKLAEEHGDKELSQIIDVLKAEQARRADEAVQSPAEQQPAPAKQQTGQVSPPDESVPGAQPGAFADLDPGANVGLATLGLPAADAGLNTMPTMAETPDAPQAGTGGLAQFTPSAIAVTQPEDSPTPEAPETLAAQMDAFAAGRKPAVLVTPGEKLPEIPKGAQTAEIPDHGTLIYKDPAVLELAQSGRMGEALGYGIEGKPVSDTVVTAKDAEGRVVQDVLTDGRPEVVTAAEQAAGPGGTVETRPAMVALADREKANQPTKGQKVRQVDPLNDSLTKIVAKLGGIDIKDAESNGIDRADMKRFRAGLLPAFTKPGNTRQGGIKGDSLDGMRERVNQYGFNFETEADFLNALMGEIGGKPIYTAEGEAHQFEKAQPTYLQHDAAGEAPAATDMAKPIKKLTKKAMARMWPSQDWEYDAADIDVHQPEYDAQWDEEHMQLQDLATAAERFMEPEKIDEVLQSGGSDGTVAAKLWEIIQNGRKSQASSRVPAQEKAGAAEPETASETAELAKDFELTTQSEADIRAKESREQGETIAAKEQADKEAEHFNLTQQIDDTPPSTGQGLFTADGRPSAQAETKPEPKKKLGKKTETTKASGLAEMSEEDFEALIDGESAKPRNKLKSKKKSLPKRGRTAADIVRREKERKASEAAEILKRAGAHGVKGADEALTGLAELFGGKGKLSSGLSFDEETYAKAVPHFKAALESFIEAGKSIGEFVNFVVNNFGAGVKPYLMRFHKDVKADKIKIRGINDDANPRADQAGDRAESADQERADQEDAANADHGAGRATGDAALEPGKRGMEAQSDFSLYQSQPPVSGESGVSGVPETEGRPGTDAAAARSEQPGRHSDAGATRVPDGAGRSERPGKDADTYRRSVAEKLKLQKSANKIPLTYGDPANVRETLPFLLPEQQDDVIFAERRFMSGNEPGVMFTNGTGTGKTYTGLGIVKRHMRDTGSADVLMVVPAGKVNDWIEDARNLQISASKLTSKKDAGDGVTVTSFQNFQDNWELQSRDFSLILYDESHYLGQAAQGETMAYDMHRAAANHEDGLYWKAQVRDPKAKELEYARRKYIDSEIKRLETMATDQSASYEDRKEAAERTDNKEKLRKELNKEFHESHRDEYIKVHDRARDQQKPLKEKYHRKNKVLFLSASPFAYHRSLDYAEGYLFSYGKNEQQQGYYTITPRDQFFISNFGYRFRYGKLTTPGKEVDVGLMERRFNESLKKSGAVRGRMLEVDYDYSREFVVFNSELGNKVDRGLSVLRGLSPEGEFLNKAEMEAAGHPVFEELPNILRKKFNYSYLSQLTEAIKAENLTDRIEKHLRMGRKVVVFHDFQKTIDTHPFRFNDAPIPYRSDPGEQIAIAEKIRGEIATFNEHYPELGKLPLDRLKSVVETISDTFGDRVAVIKGGVSANKKTELIKKYQADDSGIDVIVVQRQSGREGISLHDITGNRQRVLIDMGLPIRPVDSLQTEGRVYRYAVSSDAIIEYPVLGTTFERIMFASKVAERSRMAENLAMGNQARDMEMAFKEGYVGAAEFDPHKEQGKGGKASDRARREDEPFDIAKSLYFGRRKVSGRRDQRDGLDYFSTPEPLGLKMVEWAGARPGERGMEPSAGHGAIARWFPEDTSNVFVEPSAKLSAEVGLLSNGASEISTFEDVPVESKFGFIVMNPPFGAGGATAMAHLDKAMRHLKNGGRIVALLPEGPSANKKLENLLYGKDGEIDKLKESYKKGLISGGVRDSRLRQLQNFHVMADYGLPRVTFERAGTQVKAHVVVIDRYDNPEDVPYQQGRIDLNHEDINELFEAIQNMSGPQRGEVSTVEEDAKAEEGAAAKKPESAGVEKSKGYHSKKQKDIWYVHLTGPRIGRDDFVSLKGKAKDLGGYYSAWKGGGATPGFIFGTEEDADAFMQKYSDHFGDAPKFMRSETEKTSQNQRSSALSPEKLDAVLKRITVAWKGGPDIVAVDNFSGLPGAIKQAAEEQGAGAHDIHGVSYRDEVYVVRSMMSSEADVERVLFHEAYGHYGLAKLFGEDIEKKLNQIYLGIGGSKGLARLAKKHGIDLKDYAVGSKDMAIEQRRALMAEELLAHIAQDSKPTIARKAKEIIGAIRQWLRRHGLLKLSEVSDSEIMHLLKMARDSVLTGKVGKGLKNKARFMVGKAQPDLERTSRKWKHAGTVGGMPSFSTGEVTLIPHKEINQGDDAEGFADEVSGGFSDIGLMGHAVKVMLGERVYDYTVYEGDSAVGSMVAGVKEGAITSIHDIEITEQRHGIGEKVVSTIVANASGDVLIADITPEAEGFWERIGAGYINVERDSKISWSDYRAARIAQKGAQGGAGSAIDRGGKEVPEGVAGEEGIKARFMRRGRNDRLSDDLASRFGLGQKKGRAARTIEQIRSTPPGDLKRYLSDELTQGSLDRFYGIKAAEEQYSGPLDASQSGYVATRLSTGLSSIVTATLHYGTPRWSGGILQKIPDSKGLLEILGPVSEELNDWLAWMGGRRAQRLMKEGRENNLTKDQIKEALALSAGREELFQGVADEYAEFMGRILDVAQEAGLIKAEDRAAWEHADYVPFYRISVDDMFRGVKGPKANKGISHQTAGIRQLRGGEQATNDLLENIIMNVTHLLDASVKNNALGKTLRNLKGTGVYEDATMEFKRELIPMSQVKAMIERNLQEQGWPDDAIEQYIDMMPKEVISGLQKMWAMKAPDQPDVVRVMINGKARYYRVKDPLLLRAMTQINTEKSHHLSMRVMRSFKRVLTAGVTASPEFMARNFIRDALHAYTINDDKFTPVVDSVRGAAKTLRLWAKDVDHEATGGAIDMMFAGGSFLGGYISGTDPTETAVAIRKALRKRGFDASSADAFMASIIDTPVKYWERYREIGDAIENASREAVFEAAVKAGKSKAQAIFEAKDLMDYSMQGQYAIFQFLGDVVPFFNARLQGLYKLKRAGAIPGWANKGKVLARGGLIAAASLALLAWNWDDDRYEELPDWDKDLYWHFFFDKADGASEHYRIPKPFEVGVIYGTVPERMARYFGGKDDERKAMKQLLWNITETFNLVQMPQIGKPIWEVIANKDGFTGFDIEGLADEGKKKSARYNEQTSATMRKLGEAFGDTINLSPKQMEHLWRGYLGTLGMYALGASDIAVRWATDAPERPDLRPDQYPILKSFYRGSDPARTTRYKTEMYDMLRKLEEINRTIRAYAKEGRKEEAKALYEENAKRLESLPVLRRGAKKASQARKQIDEIIRDTEKDGAQKRQEIDDIYRQLTPMLKKAVENAYL